MFRLVDKVGNTVFKGFIDASDMVRRLEDMGFKNHEDFEIVEEEAS